MRIVEVIPSLDVGGAERLAALLSVQLSKLGHQVSLVSLYDPVQSWILDELRAAGIDLHFCGKRPGLDPRMVTRLAALFSRLKPDVIHTHLHTLKYVLPARVRRPRAPVAHTLHNLAKYEVEPTGQVLQGLAFRAGVAPVAIGDAIATSIVDLYGVSPAATIPNGIAVADFQVDPSVRREVRASLGLSESAPVFIAVGRLNPQKNHAGLLAAFAAVGAPDACLLIAGEGQLRSALMDQIGRLGLAERVRLLGVRPDVARLFAAADVFVLASHYEGNPLVVMEAMAAGLPVIATAVGSVPELVGEGTGWLVEPDHSASLTRAMRAALDDLPGARARGLVAAQFATDHFDVSVMAAAYVRLFDAIRKNPRRARPKT